MTETALDLVIRDAAKKGCTLVTRDERTATIVEPKQINVLGCILLGFLPYLLWYALVTRDKTWYLELQEDGTVLQNGKTIEEIKKQQAAANLLYAVAFLAILGACCWIYAGST